MRNRETNDGDDGCQPAVGWLTRLRQLQAEGLPFPEALAIANEEVETAAAREWLITRDCDGEWVLYWTFDASDVDVWRAVATEYPGGADAFRARRSVSTPPAPTPPRRAARWAAFLSGAFTVATLVTGWMALVYVSLFSIVTLWATYDYRVDLACLSRGSHAPCVCRTDHAMRRVLRVATVLATPVAMVIHVVAL